MIARLIRWSIHNRFLVLMTVAMLTAWGAYSVLHTPLDAIPDLSDVQVIIKTSYPGQAPQVVEDQVTYPVSTTMLSVPGAKVVRGYSMFGESFVYVLFEDHTDLYWARSRVLEYLSQVQGRLPATAQSSLGPDATGVGWIYEYALVDHTGKHDLAQLRALQDWFLRYELKTVPDVAEVATLGGMVNQYQVVLVPDRLRALKVSQNQVVQALQKANSEAGGSVLDLAEAEYMVRATGYLKSLDDFRAVPIGPGSDGTPILLRDVAVVQRGPEIRRGIADLNGEGEVVGGVIILRSGKNALATIDAVKAKLATLQPGLPAGVEIVPTYDRSELIRHAISNLKHKLTEEFVIVALVCAAFLFHLRSSLVAIVTLPLGVLVSFIVMRYQGVNANIMSLGGIAIAIGAMVDAAIVMIENAHKHLERWRLEHGGGEPSRGEHFALIGNAASEVGPALFFSLLIITLSFVPVFTLEAQEGRLFSPLAFTKTYAMAAAAGLSVTLVPVLMTAFVRGHIREESDNPLNRVLVAAYRPALAWVMDRPWLTLGLAAIVLAATAFPVFHVGSEFMPPLNEGTILYMPSALPGLSAQKAAQLLQQTDRLIKQFPEVQSVFGKAGRADTATDPAPLEMFETTIQFKPTDQWPAGMTMDKLTADMDAALRIPGFSNIWVPPIRNRIDMLATGIKSPVGIKVAGPDLNVIEKIGGQIEQLLKTIPGTASAFSERVTGGRYIEVRIDRLAAARYGLNVQDVQDIITYAVGGEGVTQTIEGLQRFPVNVRYPRELRDSPMKLEQLPIVTSQGATVTLGSVAQIVITDGPNMIRSENSRPNGWIYVDIRGRDLGSYVTEARRLVGEKIKLPPGYSISWSGQYEYLARATQRLEVVVPFTLGIILILLYLIFRRVTEAVLIMVTLPFALAGGFWLIYLLGFNMSIASAVGFIALAGVTAEFGVVMLLYVNQSVARHESEGRLRSLDDLRQAIEAGAALRVRPLAMTVAVVIAGLLPILFGTGTGSEVMRRIAAPMIGGMVTAPVLTMFVVPAAYLLIQARRLARSTLG